jgi:5'(3')-deoxyribonucleotidase
MNMKQKYNIYCDMDGVLVDFNKGYRDLTGIDISGSFHDDPKFWEPINRAGYGFWMNLDWLKDGKKLWNYIEKYNPEILSAPSKENDSRIGKHDWVKRELPGVHLILRTAQHKIEFASPHSILIDDRPENIENWTKAGGIAIHHTSADNTIKELQKLSL